MKQVKQLNSKIIIPDFLNLFKDGFKTNREKELLVSFIKEHNKSKNTFYVLEIENKSVGLICLKFDNINTNPTLDVEYLFVHKDYRKKSFACLKNKKISQFLLDFVIKNIAPKIKSLVNFRYLSIYPDKQNKKLIKYYLYLIPNSLLLHYKKENWILLKI